MEIKTDSGISEPYNNSPHPLLERDSVCGFSIDRFHRLFEGIYHRCPDPDTLMRVRAKEGLMFKHLGKFPGVDEQRFGKNETAVTTDQAAEILSMERLAPAEEIAAFIKKVKRRALEHAASHNLRNFLPTDIDQTNSDQQVINVTDLKQQTFILHPFKDSQE